MPPKIYLPLPRAEVIKAVERKSPWRIPLVQAKWWGEGYEAPGWLTADILFLILPKDRIYFEKCLTSYITIVK